MHFAEATLFLDVASLIWAFDIEAPIDATGQRTLPDIDMTHWSGILPWCAAFRSLRREPQIRRSAPEPFAATFNPREGTASVVSAARIAHSAS
jgi:hypothetical protein